MHKRTLAKLTGWSLIFMAVIAAFALGYAYPEFYSSEHEDLVKQNLSENTGLYQGMLAAIMAIIILDAVVSYTIYEYFKSEHQRISLTSGVLRMAYTFIFGTALYFLAINLNSLELGNDIFVNNFELFQSIWDAGLVVFGGHLLLVGYLMKLHKPLPNLLAYIAMLAGISYMTVHALKFTDVSSNFLGQLEMVLALPMIVGELGLATWLVVKGGKLLRG